MAVNGAANAAILSIEILSLEDETLRKKLSDYRAAGAEKVKEKDKALSI